MGGAEGDRFCPFKIVIQILRFRHQSKWYIVSAINIIIKMFEMAINYSCLLLASYINGRP